MAELRVHLALERASGVLAGIVAALAQKKLELKTQKLTRATEGRGGALDIRAEGEPGDIGALAEHLGNARGVGEVVRIEVDGVIVYFDGAVVVAPEDENNPFTLDDEPGDVDSELDAFLEPEPAAESEPPPAPVESEAFLQPDEPADSGPDVQSQASETPAEETSTDNDELGPLLRPIEKHSDMEPSEAPASTIEPRPEPPPEPAADTPTSGWGDEELDDWADDVESLEHKEPQSEVGIEPEADADAPVAEPEAVSASEGEPPQEPKPETTEAASNGGTSEPRRSDDDTGAASANGADRTAATLRRRRRRRR